MIATTHSIEVLESEADHKFDIRVDGYVHKRHSHLSAEATEQTIRALRLYYANIGDKCRVSRPVEVV
jgi:hypothetical protein